MQDFNWSDADSVIVENVDAIAVYTNPDGDAVIRQQGQYPEEDTFVVIPITHLPGLIAALNKLK